MHVISRRTNEGIVINGEIEITVLEIHQDHVRLGCYSPHCEPEYWEQRLYCGGDRTWMPRRGVAMSTGSGIQDQFTTL